ncbi:hypothetical protein JTB14_016246 [Gonioctena quinquepunctata]|nr:hypothetical protein JTB14_016246 [Gonioctena quinquepunctata]
MFVIASILLICIGYPETLGITTTHHDKPEDSSISSMAIKMGETDEPELINITLTASERQKRLLPYSNFYQTQPFNSPSYQLPREPPLGKYRFIPKKTYNQYDDYTQNRDILYHSHIKYTPFSENNAIPGPFRPMLSNPPSPRVKVQYVSLPQNKVPNYSAIYDKFAQLKLSQNYRGPPYLQINPSVQPPRYVSKPQINYNRYKLIQPSKTTIETFTATSIDLTSGQGRDEYQNTQNFEYLRESTKPLVQPQSNYGQKEYPVRKPYQEVPRKPYIIVPVSSQERQPAPIIVLQRKPVFREKPKYAPQDITKYIQIAPPRYVSPKYEEYQSITDYNEYQYVPGPKENPVKYASVPRYQDTNEYKKYQAVSPTGKPLEYENPEYREIAIPKYNEFQEVSPTTESIPQYETFPKYQYSPKYEYDDALPTKASPVPAKVSPTTESIPIYEKYPKYKDSPKYEHDDAPPTKASPGLAEILRHLQSTNTLPKTLTADNIDNSIKTLVKILDALKKQQKFSKPIVVPDSVSPDYNEDITNEAEEELPFSVSQRFPEDTPDGGTPGKPGRYKGFFGDPDTNCQVWHYCDLNGGQASFLCPNGTIFSQVALTCDWWYNVKCDSTAQLYVLNERLYKYIIPLSPKFPEDYSGPLVDKYLALKFQEMEEKMRKQKKGKGNSSEENESEELQDIESENAEKHKKVESSSSSSQQKETLDTIEDANEMN